MARTGRAAEAGEQLREVLGDLVLVGHGDTVAVVPDRQHHRRLQHADRVDRLPEQALGAAGVADGAEGHLVAMVREPGGRRQLGQLAVQAGGVGEPGQARHLRGHRRQVGGGVDQLDEVAKAAVGVDQAGREVGVHRPPAGARLEPDVGIGVELGEELLDGEQAEREHHGLIAVVAGAEVALAQHLRQRQVRHLLAVAEDAELGLAGEHLAAADQARLAALAGDAVIVERLLAAERGDPGGRLGRGGRAVRCVPIQDGDGHAGPPETRWKTSRRAGGAGRTRSSRMLACRQA